VFHFDVSISAPRLDLGSKSQQILTLARARSIWDIQPLGAKARAVPVDFSEGLRGTSDQWKQFDCQRLSLPRRLRNCISIVGINHSMQDRPVLHKLYQAQKSQEAKREENKTPDNKQKQSHKTGDRIQHRMEPSGHGKSGKYPRTCVQEPHGKSQTGAVYWKLCSFQFLTWYFMAAEVKSQPTPVPMWVMDLTKSMENKRNGAYLLFAWIGRHSAGLAHHTQAFRRPDQWVSPVLH
jgi:hypothetical protein